MCYYYYDCCCCCCYCSVAAHVQVASKHLAHFYADPNITVAIPAGKHWVIEQTSFWELGNDVARRMERAAATKPVDLANPDFHISNISEPKSHLVYINENLFRALLPAFEEVTEIYQNDMLHLHELIVQVVAVSTAVQCAACGLRLAVCGLQFVACGLRLTACASRLASFPSCP